MNSSLRVLVVDDSKANRDRLISVIESSGFAEVAGEAEDGAMALRQVNRLAPDAITLDLEMPRMDGFSFLRALMSSRPTPVIVVSSHGRKENVFRALDLGALDFVARDETLEGAERTAEIVRSKLSLLRGVCMHRRQRVPPSFVERRSSAPISQSGRAPRYLVVIGASTGGPTAVTQVLSRLSHSEEYAVLVAQHMPASFTASFARRLNRFSMLEVKEAGHREVLSPGSALVCPGGYCMDVVRSEPPDHEIVVHLRRPRDDEHYVPNASGLMRSAAATVGHRAIGVVLTGMGDDGAEGAKAIAEAGGIVLIESEASSVVFGMPAAASRVVPEALPLTLPEIALHLTKLVSRTVRNR